MFYAYLIEDVRALSDLFKVNLAPKRSAHGHFTAYRVRHPEFAARRALVLCGVSSSAVRSEIPASVGRQIKVSVEEGNLYWHHDKKKQELEVFGYDSSAHLAELIGPVRWEHDAEHDVPVIFWLDDASLMSDVVRRSLYLNNDRIQLATIEHGGKTATLVRIEAPSYYLLAWCGERDRERLRVYYPMTEGPSLFVEWGYVHPLADLWRRAWTEQGDRWAVFPADAHYEVLDKPDWHSIYDIADFSVEIDDSEVWTQIADQVDRFEISLKLAPRHEPGATEMLLLKEHERTKLESFLSISSDDEIDLLELSSQKDEDGEQWFFVREKHRGDGVMLANLGGQGFSRYRGFDNLFLPIDLLLEPQMRRDQYKQLFELEPSTLTFVVPPKDGKDLKSSKQIKIKKSSFEPLSHFVDHVVHFERDALMSILADSIFDLEDYKRAPTRPDMQRPGAGAKPAAGKAKAPAQKGTPQARLRERMESLRKRQRRKVAVVEEQVVDEKKVTNKAEPTELELLEGEIERDLVRRGPLVELWQELLDVKRQNSKWQDAIVCSVEGLWSSSFPIDTGKASEEKDIAAFRDAFADVVKKAGSEPAELAVVSAIIEAGQGGSIAKVMESAGKLRNVESKLSKKIRWLAWREILSATKDVRTQEEVRELLLNELNQRGLNTVDTATFLRERILKDPELEFDDEGSDDGHDTSYVLQNIEVIESSIDRLRTTKIKYASRASLARILAGMGMNARARELIESALEGMEESMGQQAADSKGWTSRVVDFFRSRSNSSSTRLERWHVWVALNAWLVFQRIEPNRAKDAKEAYDFMFSQLQSYEKEELKRTAESLEARVGQSNVAEFLALDTRSFFSSRDLPDAMTKVVTGIKNAHKRKTDTPINDLVSKGVQLAMRELSESSHPSLETVARLILEMVEGLRRLKWEKEQRPVELFEKFVHDLPMTPTTPEASRLYFAVLHCAAARALMDLGREKEAMARLVDIMNWVGEDYMQVLDFVDLVKKEVLLAIELAPRNQRTEALKCLMNTLVEQERLEIGDDRTHPGAGFEMPFQAYELIQMIDHTLEAAISNEKLVLRRLRDFEEREEARIRYWVQRDQPAAAE